MKKAKYIDELIQKHGTIMDRYDPEQRVGLIIDEWGTWFDPEPGTNPGFLYQQNTIRDALVAASHFHIFHQHCRRVQMANIAQTVNVLQAMILTEGERMLLTPTYHVFNMFKVHQDASLLATETMSADYEWKGETLPQISISASKQAEGDVNITICNIDHQNKAEAEIELRGLHKAADHPGVILTAEKMNAHNTFDDPHHVKPESFRQYTLSKNKLKVKLPPMSVVLLTLRAYS